MIMKHEFEDTAYPKEALPTGTLVRSIKKNRLGMVADAFYDEKIIVYTILLIPDKRDFSYINDAENENLDDSCGGGGFSVSYLLGQEEVAMESGVAVFPSTCRCNSCDCPGAKGGNPCEGGCQEKNGKHGGYVCTGQKQKKER